MEIIKPMKVLHLIAYNNSSGSGAAISMKRLDQNLRIAGIDSKILCNKTTDESPDTMEFERTNLERMLDALLKQASQELGLSSPFKFSSRRLTKHPAYK